MAEKDVKHRYRVIGTQAITGRDGEPVATGGVVELDPDAVNIPALVEGGHVEPLSKAAEKAAEPAPPGVA